MEKSPETKGSISISISEAEKILRLTTRQFTLIKPQEIKEHIAKMVKDFPEDESVFLEAFRILSDAAQIESARAATYSNPINKITTLIQDKIKQTIIYLISENKHKELILKKK